jgi:hypothetical protein
MSLLWHVGVLFAAVTMAVFPTVFLFWGFFALIRHPVDRMINTLHLYSPLNPKFRYVLSGIVTVVVAFQTIFAIQHFFLLRQEQRSLHFGDGVEWETHPLWRSPEFLLALLVGFGYYITHRPDETLQGLLHA